MWPFEVCEKKISFMPYRWQTTALELLICVKYAQIRTTEEKSSSLFLHILIVFSKVCLFLDMTVIQNALFWLGMGNFKTVGVLDFQ